MTQPQFSIDLGVTVQDPITGYVGIVTARVEYLTGCRQYSVTPRTLHEHKTTSEWFDESRLLVMDSEPMFVPNSFGGIVVIARAPTGGPPTQTGYPPRS